jgi:hypothetical protein
MKKGRGNLAMEKTKLEAGRPSAAAKIFIEHRVSSFQLRFEHRHRKTSFELRLYKKRARHAVPLQQ